MKVNTTNASMRRNGTRRLSFVEPNEKSGDDFTKMESRGDSVVSNLNSKIGILPDASEVDVVEAPKEGVEETSGNVLQNTGFSENGRITTPEEYEMYAMAQLRAASPKSMLRN